MIKLNIQGLYRKAGSEFFNEQYLFKLVKGKRLPINNKTPEFLILKACCGAKLLPDGSKERYVSGIFWKTNNTFGIDFDGVRYNVEVTPDGLQIVPAVVVPAITEPAITEPAVVVPADTETIPKGKGL